MEYSNFTVEKISKAKSAARLLEQCVITSCITPFVPILHTHPIFSLHFAFHTRVLLLSVTDTLAITADTPNIIYTN